MRKALLTFIMALFGLFAAAQVGKTINVETPGTLNTLLTGSEKETVTDLTLTGNIDARDVYFMRDSMPILAVLDMEAVSIEKYGFWEANKIPDNSFFYHNTYTGKISLKTIKFPTTITSIGSLAFRDCSGLTGSLTIPHSVTSIDEYAFFNCNGFTGTLTIPTSVTSIGDWAFYNCSGFTGNLTISNSVTSIGSFAFRGCNGFTGSLAISNSVTSIGFGVFYECSGFTGSLIIPNSVTSIGTYAFKGCSGFNGNLTIPNSVTSIGSSAFKDCSGFTGSLTIPNSIISIGESAFYSCTGFSGSLTIPNSVNSIEDYSFHNCSGLTGSLTIPYSITSIGSYVFNGCSGFTDSLTIPSSVTSIGNGAFMNCSGFTKVIISNLTPLIIQSETFYNVNKTICELIVPIGSTLAYRAADYWKDFVNIGEKILVNFNTGGENAIGVLILSSPSIINEPPAPTKTGYTFDNWYYEVINEFGDISNNNWNFNSDVVTTNTTLHAKWNINSYLISFNSNGGSFIDNTFADFNFTILEPITPSKTGYTFDRWYKEGSFINAWDFASDVVSKNTTLYAKWNINSYSIAFNSNGGSLIDNISANFNSTISEPITPSRTGYTFAGWYKEASFTNVWDFAIDVISKNTTLYAKWNINSYSIAFNSNGGSSIDNTSAYYNFTIPEPIAPNKTGYTFRGWYKESSLNNLWNFTSDVATSNFTLYARWEVNKTINVEIPGTLYTLLTNSEKDTVTDLTLTGNINARDIYFIRDYMPVLIVLDMEAVNIVAYGDQEANKMPDYSFFHNNTRIAKISLKTIIFPTSITSIGEKALKNCTGLTGSLIIPNSVTSIGNEAFASCIGFTGNLIIPNSVTSIGYSAFTGCTGFTGSLTISNSVTSIEDLTFSNCTRFTGSLTIPNSVTSIGYGAFQNCSGFTDILTIPNSVKIIDAVAFSDCSGFTGNLTIPNSVNSIGFRAFYNCRGLSGSLTIPNSVTSLGSSAFDNCIGLTGLTILASITSIKGSTFAFCSGLNGSLTIPNSVTTIGYWAFMRCNFDILTIPSSVTSIDNFAFQDNYSLRKIFVAQSIPPPIEYGSFLVNHFICELIVPLGAKATYKAANYWNMFTIISEKILVTFNTGGGSAINDLMLDDTTIINEPSTPFKYGYTFAGWYKEQDYINSWNFLIDSVTENTTLYAKWNINSYSITFNSNGGNDISNLTADYNTIISEPTIPTRIGYTFGGWFKDASLTNVWNFASDVITSDITLYAKWKINSYTVYFNTKGGSIIDSIVTNYKSKISPPPAPIKTGYTFISWYYEIITEFGDISINGWVFDSDVVTANTTLIAFWNINSYNIHFNSNGGNTINDVSAKYNSTISEPTTPIKTGYTFGGWYKDASLTNEWNFINDFISSDTILHAKWNINRYSIAFNSNGGSYFDTIIANYRSAISEPSIPTKTGYTFDGWYKDASLTNVWNFANDVISSDTTLYAKWDINIYDVNFNCNGGNFIENVSAEHNSTIKEPATPIKTGYTFGGWYKDVSLTNSWNFASDVIYSDTTLYAKWSINSYKVIFYSGSSSIPSISADYNSIISEPAKPVLNGYTFVGWFKEASRTNLWDFASDVISSDTTLYAKWKLNTYTVKFETFGGSLVSSKIASHYSYISAPLNPKKTGFTFNSWYKDSLCTTAWNFSTDFIISDTTLYAKWDTVFYGIFFHALGGDGSLYINAGYDSKLTEPEKPTQAGYKFVGWYKDVTYNNTWNFDVDVVTGRVELYAKWDTIYYKVHFNTDQGSEIPDVTTTYYSTIAYPEFPTKTGYYFDGWYNSLSFSDLWEFSSDFITSDTILYAKWTPRSFYVTFESNGGSSVDYQDIYYKTVITKPTNPELYGYTFAGWYKDVGLTSAWDFTNDVVTEDMKLYAKWDIKTFTISFVSNGGNSVQSIKAVYNSKITAPAIPTKEGYIFDRWYIDPDFEYFWSFNTSIVTKDTTLYAKWIPATNIVYSDFNSVNLFPNPSNEHITLTGTNIQAVSIYDMNGALILKRMVDNSSEVKIFIYDIKPGNYIVNVKTNYMVQKIPLIKK